jgi:hypothetical protein
MSSFTNDEKVLIKNIVAKLSIKKASSAKIIEEVYQKTNKKITTKEIYNVRQCIKEDSYQWFKTQAEGQYEYIREFKDRIEEILWQLIKHHNIIEKNQHSPQIQQTSLSELQKLNITLSNYFNIAPGIVNGITIPAINALS